MAIQISYTDNYGTTHGSSYIQISAVSIDTKIEGNFMTVLQVDVFVNAAARSKGDVSSRKASLVSATLNLTSADSTTYFADSVLDDADKSPLERGYVWLKTQNFSAVEGHPLPLNFTTGTTDV